MKIKRIPVKKTGTCYSRWFRRETRWMERTLAQRDQGQRRRDHAAEGKQ